MASTVSTPSTGHPHIVALVLQSKKALQQGEQLCSRAHALSNASAQAAVDVLALDAKVKWITGAVLEQLKVRKRLNSSPVLSLTMVPSAYFSWPRTSQSASSRSAACSMGRRAYVDHSPYKSTHCGADSALTGMGHATGAARGRARRGARRARRTGRSTRLPSTPRGRRRVRSAARRRRGRWRRCGAYGRGRRRRGLEPRHGQGRGDGGWRGCAQGGTPQNGEGGPHAVEDVERLCGRAWDRGGGGADGGRAGRAGRALRSLLLSVAWCI